MPTLKWVTDSCLLLRETAAEFARTRPFEGLTIGTAIHLEPKTAVLLLTLRRGGARVVATGNLVTTQPDTVRALRDEGVEVVGGQTDDPELHHAHVARVLSQTPDLLLDNGGDLFAAYAKAPYETLLGGTEETTSGRARLLPLRERIARPLLVVNDSPIKQFAENEHAVGQSILEAFQRITNRATNGRRVTVFGYGACGRGIAANFRGAHALVSVVDTDPVSRLRALFDGFAVPEREQAIADADVIITATGAREVVTGQDLALLSHRVILANAGHTPEEIDVPGLLAHPRVADVSEPAEGVTTLVLDDGTRIDILAAGHIANLSGPHPLGNSVESMDLGFTLQARCLEAVALGTVGAEQCVVPVPADIDDKVARAYLSLTRSPQATQPTQPTEPPTGARSAATSSR